MRLKMITCVALLFAFISSCQQDNCRLENPELLHACWKVYHINRGGEQIGGPGFRGSMYTFQTNGIAKAENARGDTATMRYEQRCDTLEYIFEGGREIYRIDTLTKDQLKLSYTSEGIPSVLEFIRVQ